MKTGTVAFGFELETRVDKSVLFWTFWNLDCDSRSRLVALVCVHLKPLALRTLCVRSFEMREKDFDISFPHAFCRVLKM